MLYKLPAKQVRTLKGLDLGFIRPQRKYKQKVSFEIIKSYRNFIY
jgi:hypothetical protein